MEMASAMATSEETIVALEGRVQQVGEEGVDSEWVKPPLAINR